MMIASYLRLSCEDVDLKNSNKSESESISNQRGLLRAFIDSKPEFAGAEIVEFCDDGWSGKNFERPGFLAMMEQVKQGGISCIIVKDLSRFGRDYLVVGNYISRVFPFLGVRFIAVNDGFDSSRSEDIDSLDTSFKALIYDLYSQELSSKVKNAKRQRAEKGLFLSPFAPYGYVKDPDNKNCLLIDKEAADVVRRVFQLAVDGMKPNEIAAAFNREGILSPMMYKQAAGCSRERWPSLHDKNFWTPGFLFKILRDERYIGKCVYGKRERDFVGNVHTVKKARSDWVVVEETHEGIVSKELFAKVQTLMKEYHEFEPVISERNPLRGKVKCGICGYTMRLSNTTNAKYHCQTAGLGTGFQCSREGFLQADIYDAVVSLIRTYAQYAVSFDKLAALRSEKRVAAVKQAKRELAVLQSRKSQFEKRLQDLYETFIDGSISRETYLTQKQSITMEMQELTNIITSLEKASLNPTAECNSFIDKYKEYTELETLTGEIARELVKSVVIYPGDVMKINLNLRDELEALMQESEALSSAS